MEREKSEWKNSIELNVKYFKEYKKGGYIFI